MKPGRPTVLLRRSLLFLLLLILLPALFYTAYEVNSLSTGEELMASIYRQQLEAVLFSLNQYTWDVASGWATAVTQIVGGTPAGDRRRLAASLVTMRERSPVLQGVFVADSSGADLLVVSFAEGSTGGPAGEGTPLPDLSPRREVPPGGKGGAAVPSLRDRVAGILTGERERVDRLFRYHRSDYRSVERFRLPGDTASAALLFVVADPRAGPRLAGVIVNEDRFLRGLLHPRVQEAAGGRFVLGIVDETHNRVLLSTEEVTADRLLQRRRLWLFPELALGIRLRGESIEDVVRARLERNIFLLVLLDVVLLAGAWLVYRGLRKELDFARMKSDFVSTVSHELRTPLALIRMYAETLEMERISDPAKKKEYVATILRETERLTRLVNNILNFSRIDAGRKEYHFSRVSLNAVVSDVLETFGDHLTQAGFRPELVLQNELPPLRADGEAVGQAVINLVDNAVKYSGDARYLKVSTGRSDGYVYVQVDDHGVGIASSHHQKIFDTFYRVIDGAVQGARGSGLGLALVKHIMDAHGGKIRLESAPGRGSSFRLLFPPDTEKSGQ